MTDSASSPGDHRIAHIELDEETIIWRNADIEQERRVAQLTTFPGAQIVRMLGRIPALENADDMTPLYEFVVDGRGVITNAIACR